MRRGRCFSHPGCKSALGTDVTGAIPSSSPSRNVPRETICGDFGGAFAYSRGLQRDVEEQFEGIFMSSPPLLLQKPLGKGRAVSTQTEAALKNLS